MGKRRWTVWAGVVLLAVPALWGFSAAGAAAVKTRSRRAAEPDRAASSAPVPAKDTGGQTFITYSQKDNKKDAWDKAGIVCEFLLAGVGIAVVVVGGLVLIRMERQTKATESAANAALAQAESLAVSERAWLLIAPAREEQDWSRDRSFHWVIRNVGRTPARLMEAQARCELVDPGQPLVEAPRYGEAIFLNDRMLAPGDSVRLTTHWGIETENGYAQVQEVDTARGFSLLAYGSVTYLDVFDRERESRFCEEYVFDGLGERLLLFRPRLDAPPAYTSHT